MPVSYVFDQRIASLRESLFKGYDNATQNDEANTQKGEQIREGVSQQQAKHQGEEDIAVAYRRNQSGLVATVSPGNKILPKQRRKSKHQQIEPLNTLNRPFPVYDKKAVCRRSGEIMNE